MPDTLPRDGLEQLVIKLRAELQDAHLAGERILGMANRLKDERDQSRAARDLAMTRVGELEAKVKAQADGISAVKEQVAQLKLELHDWQVGARTVEP